MARPIKEGLSYFPFGADFFEQDCCAVVLTKLGLKGESIVVRLLCRIYQNGYYLEWNEQAALVFAARLGGLVSVQFLTEVVNTCLSVGIFDRRMFDEYGILTSEEIQQNYKFATRRRTTGAVRPDYDIELASSQAVPEAMQQKKSSQAVPEVKQQKKSSQAVPEVKQQKKSSQAVPEVKQKSGVIVDKNPGLCIQKPSYCIQKPVNVDINPTNKKKNNNPSISPQGEKRESRVVSVDDKNGEIDTASKAACGKENGGNAGVPACGSKKGKSLLPTATGGGCAPTSQSPADPIEEQAERFVLFWNRKMTNLVPIVRMTKRQKQLVWDIIQTDDKRVVEHALMWANNQGFYNGKAERSTRKDCNYILREENWLRLLADYRAAQQLIEHERRMMEERRQTVCRQVGAQASSVADKNPTEQPLAEGSLTDMLARLRRQMADGLQNGGNASVPACG